MYLPPKLSGFHYVIYRSAYVRTYLRTYLPPRFTLSTRGHCPSLSLCIARGNPVCIFSGRRETRRTGRGRLGAESRRKSAPIAVEFALGR